MTSPSLPILTGIEEGIGRADVLDRDAGMQVADSWIFPRRGKYIQLVVLIRTNGAVAKPGNTRERKSNHQQERSEASPLVENGLAHGAASSVRGGLFLEGRRLRRALGNLRSGQ